MGSADHAVVSRYSKGLSHRNRLAEGSQSISKFSREIEPTVSQFLNVHGKFIQRVTCQYWVTSCLCSITSGAVLDACLRRSIDPRGDPGRYCTASCLFDDTWRHSLTSHFGCRDAKRRNLVPCYSISAVRREIAPLLAYEGAKYDFYSSSWEHLVSFYLPLGN